MMITPYFELLFLDADILAVNKSAGLRTIPDGYDSSLPYLRQLLEEQYGKMWVVHRLDKDTSGVILFARNAKTHRHLNDQFEKHTIKKEYMALCHGVPCWEKKDITIPLRKNGDRQHRTVMDFKNGKNAITFLRIQKKLNLYTSFNVEIKTGITHQIRAHLAILGFPIIGDKLYSYFSPIHVRPEKAGIEDKLYLHATSISFIHPATDESTHIEALQPSYFLSFVESI